MMTETDNTCHEKKEEEESPSLKKASILWLKEDTKKQRKANYSDMKQHKQHND